MFVAHCSRLTQYHYLLCDLISAVLLKPAVYTFYMSWVTFPHIKSMLIILVLFQIMLGGLLCPSDQYWYDLFIQGFHFSIFEWVGERADLFPPYLRDIRTMFPSIHMVTNSMRWTYIPTIPLSSTKGHKLSLLMIFSNVYELEELSN